ASTVLGTGALQREGPEAGLGERARRSEIQHYYDGVLDRLLGSGRVTFLGGHEHRVVDGEHLATSRVSGETTQVRVRRRLVDSTCLSPTVPATTPPPLGLAEGVRWIPVHQLAAMSDPPQHFVIVGSGKTATDAIVWLLTNG